MPFEVKYDDELHKARRAYNKQYRTKEKTSIAYWKRKPD